MSEEEFKLPPEATPEQVAQAHKDFRTKADLEQMLKEVRELTAGKDILGPDGKPVQDVEERRRMMEAKMMEYRKAKIMELGKRMHALSTSNPDFASCLALLREASCLTYFAFSEMSVIEGVDDELIGFSDEFLKKAVRNDPNDQIDNLIRRVKHNVIPFLNRKRFMYEKLMKKRKDAIIATAELHPKHEPVVVTECLHDLGCNVPAMPLGSVQIIFSSGFQPGEAFTEVFKRLRACKYLPILLSDSLYDILKLDDAVPVLPEVWWTGACSTEKSLGEVLNPVLDKHPKAQILLIPSIDKLVGAEKRGRMEAEPKHLQQALLRIVRWCLANQVLGLVFSTGSAESRNFFGPSITLSKEASNGMVGDSVRNPGEPAVEPVAPDRGGQAADGPGQDQGGPGEPDGQAG
jgi:hypothetical protein